METEQTYYCNECKHFSIHFYKGKLEHCTPCGSTNIKKIIWIKLTSDILSLLQCDRCECVGLSIWNDGQIYCFNCRKIQD